MIVYGAPTDVHMKDIRSRWLRTLVPKDDPPGGLAFGRVQLPRWAMIRMARSHIDETLAKSRVLVATDDRYPTELVGFIVWAEREGGPEVYMVHVLGPNAPDGARRMGIGTELVARVVGHAGWSTSITNTAGEALAAAVRERFEIGPQPVSEGTLNPEHGATEVRA